MLSSREDDLDHPPLLSCTAPNHWIIEIQVPPRGGSGGSRNTDKLFYTLSGVFSTPNVCCQILQCVYFFSD